MTKIRRSWVDRMLGKKHFGVEIFETKGHGFDVINLLYIEDGQIVNLEIQLSQFTRFVEETLENGFICHTGQYERNNPEEFLSNLHYRFHGSYLNAIAAKFVNLSKYYSKI